MRNIKFDKGFSLTEICIVMAMIIIAAAIAFPSLSAYYRNYKFKDYAFSMESLVKGSKLTAMERSVSIGICVDDNTKTLSIINMGTKRSGICTGDVLNTLQIEDDFIDLDGSGSAFDPKGFAIYNGNVCISDKEKYYKVVISRFGAMRIDKGSGGCR